MVKKYRNIHFHLFTSKKEYVILYIKVVENIGVIHERHGKRIA